jgi:transposase
MDTNHLERALRVIPMGAEISPYDYLVDVLQRVGEHPAARVSELTPRLWRQRFATTPLRTDLYSCSPGPARLSRN